jgi:hypothetical protein
MSKFKNDERIKGIKSQVYTLIADELIKSGEDPNGQHSLLILGSIQAVLVEVYRDKLGSNNAAMFFYSVADRLIE